MLEIVKIYPDSEISEESRIEKSELVAEYMIEGQSGRVIVHAEKEIM